MTDERENWNTDVCYSTWIYYNKEISSIITSYSGIHFLGLLIIPEHSAARVQSSHLIPAEMSQNCTFRTSTAYAQIYLHYQSVFNGQNSWNKPDFGLLFMTLMRIQICSNTFTSKVCEVWEMHFTSCKMGITTFSSPHYSFNEIINWREFIVQFRLPLQLWQKGEALTVSKLWHGAAKDMRCHHHPLRISSCSTGCDFGKEKAKPQELACTELLINVNISPQSNQQMLRISNWSAISIKCGSWQPCL